MRCERGIIVAKVGVISTSLDMSTSNMNRAVLTPSQIVVGTTCIAIPMVLNGAIGAKLHIPFSVAIRASFGYYFAYFAIVSRAILAMFWFGIQGASGAQCVTIMIQSIWPSYANIKDTIGYETQGISTKGMIRFVSIFLL